MQTYEKLLSSWDLTAFSLRINRFPLDLLKVPVRRIACIDDPVTLVSKRLGFYFNLALQASCGLDYLHLGLVRALEDFEIVHTMETFNAYSHQALQAKRRHGCKLVATVFENRPFAAERFPAKRRMKYEVLREADLLLAATARARDCLILEGADPARVEVLYPGIDVERFHPGEEPSALRRELGIEEDEVVVLSVAALLWEKGVHDLLHAFQWLGREESLRGRRLRLLIAGGGPEGERLAELAGRTGLGDRLIVRRFDYERIPEVYRAADLFVLASCPRKGWLEQFGYVLPEAMASGLPVVGTLSGSIPEVVGPAGVMVPPADFLELACALRGLIEDDLRRVELGRRARVWAEEHYDAREVARQIERSWSRLLTPNESEG